MAVYHVATTGNDSNIGTQSLPWRTINKANQMLTPGDTVIVHQGTYQEAINPVRDGTESLPITYAAAQGETALIRGVSATSPACVTLGWVSEITGSAAAHTIQFGSVTDPRSYITIDGFSISSSFARNTEFTYPEQNYNKWAHVQIDNHNSVGNVIRNCKIFHSGYSGLDNYIANYRQEGILCAGRNTLIEDTEIVGFWLGILIEGEVPRTCTVRRCNIHDCGASAIDIGAPSTTGIQGTLIEDNILGPTWNEDGVQFEPNYSHPGEVYNNGTILRGNIFVRCAENCIDLKGAGYVVIENNIAYACPGQDDGGIKQDWYLGGIQVRDTTGTLSYHNWNGSSYDLTLINNRSGGKGFIALGAGEWCSNIIVRNNIAYDNYGGVTTTEEYKKAKIYNNTFVGNNRDWTGPNSVFGGGTNRDTFTAFVCYGTGGDSGYGLVFKNNICANHNDGEVGITAGGFNASTLDIDYNLYANETNLRMFDPGGYLYTPFYNLTDWKNHLTYGDDNSKTAVSVEFVNVPAKPTGEYTAYNFALKPTSPGKGAGTHLTYVTANSTGSTIAVKDAYLFYNGYGITSGDTLLIGSHTATVVSVNSATSLTLDKSITVATNDKVSLYSAGHTPDMGAVLTETVIDDTQPPVITSQPVSVTVFAGITATFNVGISSVAACTYQWYKNGVLVPGANYSSYSVENTTANDDGTAFTCKITNKNGSVTTSVATLSVTQIITEGNLIKNGDFSVGLSPWFFYSNAANSSAVVNAASVTCRTGATGTNVQLSQAGLGITNAQEYLLSFSGKANISGLSIDVVLHLNDSPYTLLGLDEGITLTDQWQTYTKRFIATGTTAAGRLRFWLAPSAANGNEYSFTDVVLKKYVEPPPPPPPPPLQPPTIVTQPQSITVVSGAFAPFTVVATGSGIMTYQWYKNNQSINDATSDTLILENVTVTDSGSDYFCVISNSDGSVTTDIVTLTVLAYAVQYYQLVIEYVSTTWAAPPDIMLGYIGEVNPVSGLVLVRYFKPI